MADFILNLAWFALGLLLVGMMLVVLALLVCGAMMFIEFVTEWLDDMGWRNKDA